MDGNQGFMDGSMALVYGLTFQRCPIQLSIGGGYYSFSEHGLAGFKSIFS